MLVRIALARRDYDEARREADAVQQTDRAVPMAAYVEGRALFDAGHYQEAWPLFNEALAALRKTPAAQIPELHYYCGETLMRLDRTGEAEAELADELRRFPQNTRARATLATLYHTSGRPDEAARVVADITRARPNADSYALAARLWKSFGNARRADAIHLEARRALAEQASVLGRRN
jgi:predicted Zn-dependent protease